MQERERLVSFLPCSYSLVRTASPQFTLVSTTVSSKHAASIDIKVHDAGGNIRPYQNWKEPIKEMLVQSCGQNAKGDVRHAPKEQVTHVCPKLVAAAVSFCAVWPHSTICPRRCVKVLSGNSKRTYRGEILNNCKFRKR